MRILQVIDSLPLAGAEVLVKDMAPRLQTRGIECAVAVLRTLSSPLEASLEAAGVELYHTGVATFYSPAQVPRLAKLMGGYDLVHVHLFPAQLWAVLAASQLKHSIPLVTTEHAPLNSRRRWWLRSFEAWMYARYQRIACNSDFTAEELVRWCPQVAPKIRVISNGVPLDDFETASPASLAGIPDHATRVVFVGRFYPPKDHAAVLRALTAVPNAHLLLVGDGPLRPQAEELARSLGVAERVTFLGQRHDIAQILKASDIFVHSTTFDGFGIAACEAMAAGLPVIASDVPGLAQVVKGAGVLFPVGDDRALARELSVLVSSPERRREMSASSRQRAKCFSIEKTVDAYVALYESVLQCPAIRS